MRETNKEVFTVGYEKTTLDKLLDVLIENGINLLVDIREYPLSRKSGFSKTPLSKACSEKGINYKHLGQLGAPKNLRKEIKETLNMVKFRKEYKTHLTNQKDVLSVLSDLLIDNIVCLLCFERIADDCHRSILAAELNELNKDELAIINLQV